MTATPAHLKIINRALNALRQQYAQALSRAYYSQDDDAISDAQRMISLIDETAQIVNRDLPLDRPTAKKKEEPQDPAQTSIEPANTPEKPDTQQPELFTGKEPEP